MGDSRAVGPSSSSVIEGTVIQIAVKRAYDGSGVSVQVDSDWSVRRLKEYLGSQPDIMGRLKPEEVRIVSKGKELTDDQKLIDCGIVAGDTIYLVNFTPRSSSAEQSSPGHVTGSPSGRGGVNTHQGINERGVNVMNQGMPGMPGMDADLVQQMMNSPMMQSLLDSPEFMQSILDSNPQIRALREANPDLNHVFQDTRLLREAFQAMRNPNVWREMVRNTDRAISNIESIPGGHDALRRMYQQVQEPMWEAATSAHPNRPSQEERAPASYDISASEESSPLPNPWSPPPPIAERRRPPRPPSDLYDNPFGPGPFLPPRGERPIYIPPTPNIPGVHFTQVPVDRTRRPSPEDQEMLNNAEEMFRLISLMRENNISPEQAHLVNPDLLFSNSNSNYNYNDLNLSSNESHHEVMTDIDYQAQYHSQLIALRDMGFTDRQKCISALRRASGNINRAMDILLAEDE